MKTINRIVIPVDTTDVSKVAAEQGAFFAKLLNVEISIISVNDSRQYMLSKLLEEKIEREKLTAIEEVKKITEGQGVTTTTKLAAGAPASEIIKFVKDDDLIVMASKGRKGFNKFLLGSVSEEVLKTAPCTVMVIKEKTKKWTVEDLAALAKEE
ncbi:MAG TPA: universal stress protein [Thermoplasmata archaeon]|jgi:nucleotide-binding universal stress UspA family protein|nr:universal stress protein [Thermoplasmata archaeon]